MIFILSCFDLAVVIVAHPVIILSTILLSNEGRSELLEQMRYNICGNLYVFSTIQRS
jgi:hypothetical protein